MRVCPDAQNSDGHVPEILLCRQAVKAIGLSIKAIVSRGLTDELHSSTVATLGALSEEYGHPEARDIAIANRELKAMIAPTELQQEEVRMLVQLIAMRGRVLLNYLA